MKRGSTSRSRRPVSAPRPMAPSRNTNAGVRQATHVSAAPITPRTNQRSRHIAPPPSRMRKNSTFDGRVGERFGYDARNSYQGGAHAGGRSPAGRDVELPVAGAARARGPSAPPDPGDGGHDPGRAVPRVRHALFSRGAPVDPPGEAVAGAAAAGPLQHAQRAAADGATRLQPALPLVRRAEHG